ncbi:MAG: ATP-binding protein [Pseudonocardiales bacterium]
MVAERDAGPVADFCFALRLLQQDSGLSRGAVASRISATCSRSQFYTVLDGAIQRPPEWDRLVEPVVRVCTNGNEREVDYWRRRHGELMTVYELTSRNRKFDLSTTPAGSDRVVPSQLPADVNAFTGRAQELAELDRLLNGPADEGAAARDSTAVVISAVSGTAGVGKTALALRWAHRVRADFPDGQLYVNLRGYDPDQPMSATAALAGFLRTLGVAGQDIPVDVDERAASYRSLLAGRQMLVVLDNASDVEQIRPLLPGTRSCVVLVTSRNALAGLKIRHGAGCIDLDLLPLNDAVTLLRALIGKRVDTEPDAAATLAGHCARLPLALRVAAELAATRKATSLATLVAELADQRRRLDLLNAGGDSRTAVRAVFSWSYQHLPAKAARAFRLLSLHPGPDLDSYAAAALTAASHDEADRLLDLLVRVHLSEPTGPGRFSMHDLLRAYAVDLATAEDTEEERRAALTRLFDHYLTTAAAAMDTLAPAEKHRRPAVPPAATPVPPVADPATARIWLDSERSTLVAVVAHTAVRNWPVHTTHLATILFRYLDTGGHYPDAIVVHTHAVHAARRIGDLVSEAHALTNLGTVCWQQGRYEQAADHLQQALPLSHKIGDRVGEARALGNLGLVYWRQSSYEPAVEHLQRALALFDEIDDRAGEARTLASLGLVYLRQGHYKQATDHHQRAVALCREIGDRAGEADALDNLGVVYQRQGHYDYAADHHKQALTLFREVGYREGEADALANLGSFYQWNGCYDHATDHYQQALALSRELGHRAGEVRILNGLGENSHAGGQLGEAHIQHSAALTLATEIGDRYEQARAHNCLAHTCHDTGDLDQAGCHWRQALDLYTDLDISEADNVRTHLAALDQTDGDEDR